VRIAHPCSGAVAQETQHREQFRNKELAFHKLTDTPTFKKWHKAEVARRLGQAKSREKTLDEVVNEAMQEKNLLIETLTAQNG